MKTLRFSGLHSRTVTEEASKINEKSFGPFWERTPFKGEFDNAQRRNGQIDIKNKGADSCKGRRRPPLEHLVVPQARCLLDYHCFSSNHNLRFWYYEVRATVRAVGEDRPEVGNADGQHAAVGYGRDFRALRVNPQVNFF